MTRRTQMVTAAGRAAVPDDGGSGSGPDPQTAAEKTVQFINAEVLDPPTQGSISFVGPYIDQSLAMAVEDARSFVQGAEQILLVALAKALEKFLSGGAVAAVAEPAATDVADPAPTATATEGQPAVDDPASQNLAAAPQAQPEPQARPFAALPLSAPAPESGLKAIEGFMASLSTFHASMAETAHRFKVDR